jgi:anaerobic selenocysteine-containing dehydrogenase
MVGFDRNLQETTTMNKTLLGFAAATSMAAVLLAAPPAEARCYGCAVGVGVAAGVVAGAIVGSAIANSYGPAYVVQPGYVAYPAYAAGPPVACPGGYWARRPVAYDAYGRPIAWSRARFFCP